MRIVLVALVGCALLLAACSPYSKTDVPVLAMECGVAEDAAATCTGSKNCTACKNCKFCKHCSKDGGSCGVCR